MEREHAPLVERGGEPLPQHERRLRLPAEERAAVDEDLAPVPGDDDPAPDRSQEDVPRADLEAPRTRRAHGERLCRSKPDRHVGRADRRRERPERQLGLDAEAVNRLERGDGHGAAVKGPPPPSSRPPGPGSPPLPGDTGVPAFHRPPLNRPRPHAPRRRYRIPYPAR